MIRLGEIEIEIDIVNRGVHAGDSVVHLSGIDQSLLYLLASRAGRVVTREEILDTRSGGPRPRPGAASWIATFGACASSSRTTIGTRASSRRSRGQGYRFIPTFSNSGWNGGPIGTGPADS